jgi:phage protein D
MTTDYYAPAFEVTINGSELAADVSKHIVEVSVVNEPGTLDQFNLTVANPYPSLPWTHGQGARVFREGNAVRIRMGYVGSLATLFDGEITSVGSSFPSSGTPTLAVTGYTRLHRLQGPRRTRTFQDMTDRQIVEAIAAELSLTADVEDTGPKHPYVIQYNETDLAFVSERARRIRFETLVEGKTLKFRKAKDAEKKSFTLVWGRPQAAFDPTTEVLPLRSFNPTLNLMRPLSSVVVRGQDGKTREKFEGTAGAGDEDAAMGAETGSQAVAAAFSPRTYSVVDHPVSTQEEADQLARAIYNRSALEFVTGTGSAIGIPDLRAGSVVGLAGVGRFDGDYYVTQSTHTISNSGYATTFSVRSNAIG